MWQDKVIIEDQNFAKISKELSITDAATIFIK